MDRTFHWKNIELPKTHTHTQSMYMKIVTWLKSTVFFSVVVLSSCLLFSLSVGHYLPPFFSCSTSHRLQKGNPIIRTVHTAHSTEHTHTHTNTKRKKINAFLPLYFVRSLENLIYSTSLVSCLLHSIFHFYYFFSTNGCFFFFILPVHTAFYIFLLSH